jgi:hypothetical protein
VRLIRLSVAVVAIALSGCYVVPARAPDGTVIYDYYALPPVGSLMPMPAGAAAPCAGHGYDAGGS